MKNVITPQFTRGKFSWFLASLAISASVALLFGCAGPGGARSRSAAPAQPKLAAQTTFLDGTLLAQFSFEALSFHGGPGGGGKSGGPGGGHRSRRNKEGDGPGVGGPPEGGPDGDSGDDGSAMRHPNIAIARALLHVTLTNNSKETLNFAVTDVISQLGNFAIRPERFSLAPGQSGEIDPLASTFQDPLTELTVETHVRHAGKKETQTVRLLPVAAAASERNGS